MPHPLTRVSLNGLLAVEVLTRRGTLSRAADELGVSPGAVSQQLNTLEKRLGVTLFERRPSGLQPTALGSEMAQELSRGFSRLARAVELSEVRAHSQLVVSAPPVFAARWLIWRLPRFTAAYPSIQVDLLAEPETRDPDHDDVDLCIRVAKDQQRDIEEYLFPQRVFPVCSPDLLPRLTTPADLRDLPIVRDTRSMFGWDVWLGPEGLLPSDLQDGPSFSDAALCLDAVSTGAGVFLAWESLANDPLSTGRVVAPFSARRETGIHYWLVAGEQGFRSPAQRAFRTWLKQELVQDQLIAPTNP